MLNMAVPIVCASLLIAQTPASGPALAVHLRVDQPGGLPASAIGDAVDEVRRIWRGAGVAITSGGYADPVPAGAATVSLRILRTPAQRYDDQTVLAWVVLDNDGAPTPILYVSEAGVLDVLSAANYGGRSVGERPAAILQRLSARTIGRVAAHELGHYLLQSTVHPAKGLMRARYRTTDLIGSSLEPFEIPPAEWMSLRREVTRLAESQQRR